MANVKVESIFDKSLEEELKSDKVLKNFTFDCEIRSIYLRIYKNDVSKIVENFRKLVNLVEHYGEYYYSLPSNYKFVFSKKIHRVLKSRNANGGAIVLMKGQNWNPNEISCKEWITTGLAGFNCHLFDNVDNQIHGFESVIDSRGTTLRKALAISYEAITTFSQIGDNDVPNPIRKIHIIHLNKPVYYLIKLSSVFWSEQTKKSVHYYQDDFTELYKSIPKTSLPPDFGGTFVDDYTDDEYEQIILKQLPKLKQFYSQFVKRI